jgi:hypothetical protein
MALSGMNARIMSLEQWRQNFLEQMRAGSMPQLDFLERVLNSPSAMGLIKATMSAPAASATRTDAFIQRRKLPRPPRFDTRSVIALSERLARDGLIKMPNRDNPPYLEFKETMRGTLGAIGGVADSPCLCNFRLSVASFYQLMSERRIDIHGEVHCTLLDPEPLIIESGDFWLRPNDGVPQHHGPSHPLIKYALVLRSSSGKKWWLKGMKTARPGRDLWKQWRTLNTEVGPEDGPAAFSGELVVPAESYVPDQIDGIEINPSVPRREHNLAKLIWMTWLGAQFGLAYADPMLRYLVELFDAARGYEQEEN